MGNRFVVALLLSQRLGADAQGTCALLKATSSANGCCTSGSDDKKVSGLGYIPMEGPMNSAMPGLARPKFIMGMDKDYPPYAYLNKEPYGSSTDLDEVIGVGADMIKAMGKHCGFDVVVLEVKWGDCWGAGEIGKGLLQGCYHGCMTYTHAAGVRNRYMEFTNSWAIPNKPSGLIAKLDSAGKPVGVDGKSNLNGLKVV